MDLQANKTDGVVLPVTNKRISASEWNQLVGSLMEFITQAGLTPDASDNEQLLNAFKAIAEDLAIIGANTNLSNLTETGEDHFAQKDLSNVTKPYVTETYSNGSSWYRIWSDGWCEQGAYQSSISGVGPTPVTFLVTMADTNYSVFGGVVPSASSANDSRFEAYTRTTTGMNIDWTDAGHVDGTWWEVKGYKAS